MNITKKELKAIFKRKLATDTTWACRGLLAIYAKQTYDEKAMGATRHENSVGFSGCDSELLSSFARQLEERGTLSPKQMSFVFKKMPKYWEQLIAVADKNKLETVVRKEKLNTI